MRLTSVAGNPLEWVLDKLGVVPTPLMDTIVALMLARAIVTATKVGVFEALADGPRTAGEVAATCGIEPRATAKLLFALAGARYVRESAGRYALTSACEVVLQTDSL